MTDKVTTKSTTDVAPMSVKRPPALTAFGSLVPPIAAKYRVSASISEGISPLPAPTLSSITPSPTSTSGDSSPVEAQKPSRSASVTGLSTPSTGEVSPSAETKHSRSDSTTVSTVNISVAIQNAEITTALEKFDLMKKQKEQNYKVQSFEVTIQGAKFTVMDYKSSGRFVDTYLAGTQNNLATRIKVLNPEFRNNEIYRGKLERDFFHRQALSHPDDHVAFKIEGPIATQLCIPGVPLSKVKIDSQQTFFKIVKAVAKALKEFHDNKLVHGDFGPDNILIDIINGEYVATLIDLANIRQINEETSPGRNPIYQPRELEQQTLANPNSDIYGLGSILKILCKNNNLKIAGGLASSRGKTPHDNVIKQSALKILNIGADSSKDESPSIPTKTSSTSAASTSVSSSSSGPEGPNPATTSASAPAAPSKDENDNKNTSSIKSGPS